MLFNVKKGVLADGKFELCIILGYVIRAWQESGFGPFVITSLNDGQHRTDSKHYSGYAFDLRTRDFYDAKQGKHWERMLAFRTRLRHELGPHGVDVLIHPDDEPGFPHLHIEYDPKTALNRILWGSVA